METRANYAMIGLFTLGVLAAAFGFVYWFSGRDAGGKRDTYQIVFEGSVSGLSVGSLVLFNGLRVGEVRKIEFLPKRLSRNFQGQPNATGVDPEGVLATIQVDNSTPINTKTTARLEFQGLTGVASIALLGGAANGEPLKPGEGGGPPIIYAERSDFQNLLESARNITAKADDILTKVQGVVDENRAAIHDTLDNVDKFSKALGKNADKVDAFLANVGDAAKKIQVLAGDLDSVVKSIDKDKVNRIVDNTDKFTAALGTSGPDVQTTVKHLASISAKLDKAADRIDGVLAAAQGFLGSPDGKGAFQEVAEAARSIRKLADNLDKRTAEITAGINRFTGPGLREYQALATDGRKTLQNIDRTLNKLDKNPQQFIFGAKPSIPEYNGRR